MKKTETGTRMAKLIELGRGFLFCITSEKVVHWAT